MTGFRRGPEGDADLVVAARRRALDEAERAELDAALDADQTLRVAHDVGRAFDDVAFVRPGDEALIARTVDRTLGIGNGRAAPRRWPIAAAVAAGFLLVTGAATAYRAGLGARARRTFATEHQDVAPPAPRKRAMAARAGGATELPASLPFAEPALPEPAPALDPVPSPDPVPSREPAPANDGRSIARSTTRVTPASPSRNGQPPLPVLPPAASSAADGNVNVTAAELFRRAGAARRAGALAEAAALYGDLQARFPAAEEARVSHVSLGKLLLAMGRPQEAERHFAAYLAGGAGALAAEAAVGRAQSFERMGRPREEREVWLGLLRDHPDSVYARAARERIAALEATGVGPAGRSSTR
jgi:TolA-binding protein